MSNEQDYLNMQLDAYNDEASRWSLTNRDPVVGWYKDHESDPKYDTMLFKNFKTKSKVAIEYGCGPGRCLVRFADRFKRVDGCDISPVNIEKAKLNITDAGLELPNLYVCDGKSLPVKDASYDVVFSVICLQHICCHTIRMSIMKDIFRVLKPGGYFCAQMGFGATQNAVDYLENDYSATGTNGNRDVRITAEAPLINDLRGIGFKDYVSEIAPPMAHDIHPYSIWFQARKP